MENTKKTKVEVKANGPVIVSGQLEVTLSDGEVKHMDRIVLCRCGDSGNMPFCDASHNRMGFKSQ